MISHNATIPLDLLLRQFQLDLVQITNVEDDAASRAPVQWVHGSDLLDPTPFLTPRTVLLTTGSQFATLPDAAQMQRDYVTALVDAGVCALGFAINFTYERIPEALIKACEQQKLPLFRVPYSTPFIAISQTAARLLNQQAHARDAWSIAAQRAVALAALQPDGLNAVVTELSAQLGAWVAIFDNSSTPITTSSPQSTQLAHADWLTQDVQRMLKQQTRASRTSCHDGEHVSLQTLGRRGSLLGVLAVKQESELDYASHSVIGIVVALVNLMLEQQSVAAGSVQQLRTSVLQLLLGEERELAHDLAAESFGSLPIEPVVFATLTAHPKELDALLTKLQALIAAHPETSFYAKTDEDVNVIFNAASRQHIVPVLDRLGVALGLSLPSDYVGLRTAQQQAHAALEFAQSQGEHQTITFAPSMQSGVLELLKTVDGAPQRARALFEPLLSNDERHDEELVHSLQVWLNENGQFSPAAELLGIHRHTLKTRISRIGELIGRDLNSFETRAELWASLKFVDTQR